MFVPWEFVKFNVLAGGSAQYGSHPWHWNLTAGLPTVTATLLPLALAGILITRRRDASNLIFAVTTDDLIPFPSMCAVYRSPVSM